jgi:RNA polymerase sigma-70 factor (ECF subfamily)
MIECGADSDEKVVLKVFENRDVFACLVDRYESRLRRYILRIAPSFRNDADDILQEVFIKAYVNLHSFDTTLSFSSWVYRITHNETVSRIRKINTRPTEMELGEEEYALFAESLRADADVQDRRLTQDGVNRALAALDIKYREILVLRFLEERSYHDISDILKMPEGTVATLIHRAKKHFKKAYEQRAQ